MPYSQLDCFQFPRSGDARRSARLADNWRSLIAVADACSPAWGALTREAAVAFSKSCHDEDILVVLLQHILEVFDACGVDRLASKTLVDALVDMDDEIGRAHV